MPRSSLTVCRPALAGSVEAVSKIVVLHSAQGLGPGIESWAERLREAGHEVWTPELAEGRVAEAELAELPADVVYAGFSSGAASAGYYAATRSRARGAILISGVTPLGEYEIEAWPESVPAQVHFASEDPDLDRAGVESFERALDAVCARLEIHAYAGSDQRFADPDSPGYDPASAELLLARVLEFLHRSG
jgi:dienelactone hydrolase